MKEVIRKYFELIMKWNRRTNLIRVKDYDMFMRRHVDDADELIKYLGEAESVIDLGAGAGIPGILIKIERSKTRVMLVEATRKKVSFCEEAIRQLGLEGIVVVWGRAEDEGLARSVGKFDVVVSRATWKLKDYLPIAQRYISGNGICIAMKGPKWSKELEAAAKEIESSRLQLETVHEYELKDGEARTLLIFKSHGP